MNQKLSEKDMELKKMIAELEKRMMARPSGGMAPSRESLLAARGEQFEVESDYSIDSENISWKADLWEMLPEYEKKKLYDKQSAQVTKLLTDMAVSELQNEMLENSFDVSF